MFENRKSGWVKSKDEDKEIKKKACSSKIAEVEIDFLYLFEPFLIFSDRDCVETKVGASVCRIDDWYFLAHIMI